MTNKNIAIHVRPHTTVFPIRTELLNDPFLNKGTAFSKEERDAFGLYGLLPPRIASQKEQVMRVMENFRRKPNNLERYVYMMGLKDRNETLFYRVLMDNIEEMMPVIYTPTVGQACQEYGHIFQKPQGIFISTKDRGRIIHLLRNWHFENVHIIVVTDGERILGLGDLGANGMGIPVGKLSLYTACAGIHPSLCLPVTLDTGTDNKQLLKDPLYIGIKQKRVRSITYDNLVEEFVSAVQELFPHALIQFEDFANTNAFRLLEKYRNRICTFNDDIQGTAAVTLAGLYSSLKITGKKLTDQKILFMGTGEAGIGIGNLIVSAMVDEGLTKEDAQKKCLFMDSKGLVVKSRGDLAEHKLAYAHELKFTPDILSAVKIHKPTAIIGVSGQPGTITKPVLQAMAKNNQRPIIFALSNPTSKAECTAEEAYKWTNGRAVFASGSPFAPVAQGGKTFVPSQCNNAYIFPGLGLGIITCRGRFVTDEMFLTAAKTLANQTKDADLKRGSIFPSLTKIRNVSLKIAVAVSETAYARGIAARPIPENLVSYIKSKMYEPNYRSYI